MSLTTKMGMFPHAGLLWRYLATVESDEGENSEVILIELLLAHPSPKPIYNAIPLESASLIGTFSSDNSFTPMLETIKTHARSQLP